MSYLARIAKARNAILNDHEEPRDLLISEMLRFFIKGELESPMTGRIDMDGNLTILGMKVEWTTPKALTAPQIYIRTTTGDTRIVTMFDASSGDEERQ